MSAQALRIVIPESLDIASISVPEDEYPEYNPDTAYTVGTIVQITSLHRIYQCSGANTNMYPSDNLTGELPKWVDKGATNARKIDDEFLLTQLEVADSLEITLNVNKIRVISLLNLNAGKVTLELRNSRGTVIQTITDNPYTRETTSWSSYFHGTTKVKSKRFWDLKPVINGSLYIKIENIGGTVKLGKLVTGRAVELGAVKIPKSKSNLDFSTVETNEVIGSTYLKQGNSVPTVNCDIMFNNNDLDYADEYLNSIRSMEALFIIDGRHQAFIVWGFLRKPTVTKKNSQTGEINIKIEGLI